MQAHDSHVLMLWCNGKPQVNTEDAFGAYAPDFMQVIPWSVCNV